MGSDFFRSIVQDFVPGLRSKWPEKVEGNGVKAGPRTWL